MVWRRVWAGGAAHPGRRKWKGGPEIAEWNWGMWQNVSGWAHLHEIGSHSLQKEATFNSQFVPIMYLSSQNQNKILAWLFRTDVYWCKLNILTQYEMFIILKPEVDQYHVLKKKKKKPRPKGCLVQNGSYLPCLPIKSLKCDSLLQNDMCYKYNCILDFENFICIKECKYLMF